MIRVANAPCSWGALEFELEGEKVGYQKVITEIHETGYAGTELGDWGFMPTDPELLRAELDSVKLDLVGAFVPVDFSDEASHQAGKASALKTAKLLFDAQGKDTFIILADENGKNKARTKNAGRVTRDLMLNDEQWKTYAKGVNSIAKAVKEEFGIRTVFHHHCAGYVETPAEIDTLMNLTDSELVGLCLDAGHYMFGGGDPLEAYEKYKNRIWHVHFKDCSSKIKSDSINGNWDYFESVSNGIFCELGKGNVNFELLMKRLKEDNYSGWIVVEQDILPGMGSPKTCALNNREYIKGLGV